MIEPDPDSEGGGSVNNYTGVDSSQVPLFVAVGSPTKKPLDGMGLAPKDDGGYIEWKIEGGPCQRPALSTLN